MFLNVAFKAVGNVMHKQMMKSQENYTAAVDQNETVLQIATRGVKTQNMAAKR